MAKHDIPPRPDPDPDPSPDPGPEATGYTGASGHDASVIVNSWLARFLLWVDRWTTRDMWARARKYAVALAGVAAQLLAAGLIPPPWDSRAQLVLALLTAAGVYGVPNAAPGSPYRPGEHDVPGAGSDTGSGPDLTQG